MQATPADQGCGRKKRPFLPAGTSGRLHLGECHATDHHRQNLGKPCGHRRERNRPSLYRPPPRPRGDESPGLRGAQDRRPQGPPAGADLCRSRPQRPHHRPLPGHRGPRQRPSGGYPSRQCPPFRRDPLRHERPPSGDRPCDRPRTGDHPPGTDHRLRRQPHRHPRGLRILGLRDRHLRGRARPGHPDPRPKATPHHGDPARWTAPPTASPPRT